MSVGKTIQAKIICDENGKAVAKVWKHSEHGHVISKARTVSTPIAKRPNDSVTGAQFGTSVALFTVLSFFGFMSGNTTLGSILAVMTVIVGFIIGLSAFTDKVTGTYSPPSASEADSF